VAVRNVLSRRATGPVAVRHDYYRGGYHLNPHESAPPYRPNLLTSQPPVCRSPPQKVYPESCSCGAPPPQSLSTRGRERVETPARPKCRLHKLAAGIALCRTKLYRAPVTSRPDARDKTGVSPPRRPRRPRAATLQRAPCNRGTTRLSPARAGQLHRSFCNRAVRAAAPYDRGRSACRSGRPHRMHNILSALALPTRRKRVRRPACVARVRRPACAARVWRHALARDHGSVTYSIQMPATVYLVECTVM
jgi:hypothetical protein